MSDERMFGYESAHRGHSTVCDARVRRTFKVLRDKLLVMKGVDRADSLIPASSEELEAMGNALELAREAARCGEVPVGAVVLDRAGEVIGRGRNMREQELDPAGHAEIAALREAQQWLGEKHLADCTLVVTLEPCVMCAGAILATHVPHVVFGAWEEKTGAVGSVYDILRDGRLPYPTPTVAAGVRQDEAAELLRQFFAERRD